MASEATLERRKAATDPRTLWRVCVRKPAVERPLRKGQRRPRRGRWMPSGSVVFAKVIPPDRLRFMPTAKSVGRVSMRKRGTYVGRKASGVGPTTPEDRRQLRNARKAERRALRGKRRAG